jgi:hypothetical protein
MDDTLRYIQSLYGEDVDDPALARRVAEDDALREECKRLRQTKEALDRRSSPSPDPAVVDRVVDHAATAASSNRTASDRPARSPSRSRSRRLQGASAALAVILVLGLGWWQLGPDASPKGPGATANESTPQQVESAPAGETQARSDEIPEWDDRQEVVRLHRRVEMLRSRSRADTWGTDLQTVNR